LAWKNAGKPGPGHPLFQNKNEASYKLRKAQRLHTAILREKNYERIMAASKNDTNIFHNIIRKQRSCNKADETAMVYKGKQYNSPDEIRQCFYGYFKKLTEPLTDSTFDMAYEQQINFDSLLIEEITTGKSCEDIKTQITVDDVQKSIKSVNKGKAADALGITAEHIQHGGQSVVQYIFIIFQAMFDLRIVPDEIKEDLLIPILKKNKNSTEPTSYRGITVLMTLEQLFEKVWLLKGTPYMDKAQNKLQRGFTKMLICINTGFLHSEIINESKECKDPVYVVTLDGQRAFDPLWINSLMRKMFFTGIPFDLWEILHPLYTNVTTKVKWDNIPSDSFPMLQGVRQGGVLSICATVQTI
jgi:hypothetical protein